MRRALLLGIPASLVVAAPASGHSVMKVEGGTIHYTANDDTSLNRLSVTFEGDQIRFFDRGADGGINPPPDNSCTVGDETDANGYIYEILCPRSGKTAIRIDVGEAQDSVTAEVPLNITGIGGAGADTIATGDGVDAVNGGAGNDTIRSGGGNDQVVGEVGDDNLSGGAGDDVVQAALGADTADGGAGNDDIRVRDGVADRALCGDGNDRVQADDGDDVEAACESVERQGTVASPDQTGQPGPPGQPGPGPGPGGGPAPPDGTPPRVRAGGSTLQRFNRSRRLVVVATSSEAAELVGGGYVTFGENRVAFRSARRPVTVGGGGVRLTLTLAARDARKLRRFLARRKRKAVATITVVATDAAGNSSASRLPRITLQR
ncbi:MAG TPA: calcium-binding protein [Solirubrobacteraceae bacterium]|nr:calcium-binding protein [Solirubrobacteraceae bacterium]